MEYPGAVSHPSPDSLRRAARVRLILLDVDGVLTDRRIYLAADGRELKAFDATDGHGIRMGQEVGLQFGLVTGRATAAATHRAAELGITEVHERVRDKGECVETIARRLRVPLEELCFIGDDLVDLPAMRRAGFAAAPADAVAHVRELAHYVTARPGGRGAVREVVDLVLRSSGKWDEVTRRYFE
jgi:3-deoxy-D-manno-octulosonate 8-phosphate phosphatase (KDO 8-P phosphatase)